MHIVDKLQNVANVKEELAYQISRTGQNINNKTFREYSDLIENVPSGGIMSQSDINICVNKILNINGENA